MSRALGSWSEDVAQKYLANKGYAIIAKNVFYPFGEIDIVAKIDETLVFVEVKMRKHCKYGMPYEAVTKTKQRKLILAAQAFLKNFNKNYSHCRFDVVSLIGNKENLQLSHLQDAFWLENL